MNVSRAVLRTSWRGGVVALLLTLASAVAPAGVLPEDRADVLYHRYQGGGITVDGPSVLIRKKIGESFSVSGSYYVDMISSASIDVKLSASKYKEERKQEGFSTEYLHGKTTYSAGVIHSNEGDYVADTASFGLSQDMFGDLTTVSMGFRRGWNHIYRNVKLADGSKVRDPTFAQQADNRAYTLGVSQILTRNMLLSLNYEVITDQGFLNNPYRKARYFDTSAVGFSLENEIYPNTHTSNAASARVKYFLPYRAALEGSYRFYSDTWGIVAHTGEVDYTQPWKRWIFDGHLRYYTQQQADFYSDIFPRANSANFLARDRELAAFKSIAVGVGASYEFGTPRMRWMQWMQKSTVNARYDRLQIRYDNFRDATVTNPANGILAGAEPLYILDANVLELFVSIYF